MPITLSKNTSNWIPQNASNFLTLTWNYTGETINPEEWVSIELSLSVSELIVDIKTFSFDIIIIANEV